ncbi:restriction endonuclease subunit S [Streptomyces sp. NPDC056821]|uniref:restriction endonuclease subunit S n=1 Tax=unclassified Streptomyces TaxID=2593676 RepID=UPI003673C7D2
MPPGWIAAKIGDLFDAWGGLTPPKSNSSYWADGIIPWVSSRDVKYPYLSSSTHTVTQTAIDETRLRICPSGSVLVVVRSGILAHSLPVTVTKVPVTINQDLKAFYSPEPFLNEWLALFLRLSARKLLSSSRRDGTTVQSVQFPLLKNTVMPVPPVDQRRRIIASIGDLSTTQRTVSRRLTYSQELIERHRQAVLVAASSGRLTEDWRREQASEPDGDTPSGWQSVTLAEITECLDRVRKPINATERSRRVGSVPYYGANGQVGTIDESLFDEELVLVVEDETFTGRTKPFSYIISGPAWVNNHAHVLRASPRVLPEALNILLSYYNFIPLTSGSTGRQKLTQKALMDARISLPPLAEQGEIVRRVRELMKGSDEVATRLNTAKSLLGLTGQAALAKAFQGELF